VEDNLNERQPQWKTTSMEDDLNGRRPQWKTTSMEDDLNGRRPQWKTTSMEEDFNINIWTSSYVYTLEEPGTICKSFKIWRPTSMEDDPNGRRPQWKTTSM
jgi:hypothetical protein